MEIHAYYARVYIHYLHCFSKIPFHLCLLVHNVCSSNPCQNAGTCLTSSSGFVCSCQPGFQGTTCQTQISKHFTELTIMKMFAFLWHYICDIILKKKRLQSMFNNGLFIFKQKEANL